MHLNLAFDKVHYGKLFTILLAKIVSPYVIRLLIDSYVRQQACDSWNVLNLITSYYKME